MNSIIVEVSPCLQEESVLSEHKLLWVFFPFSMHMDVADLPDSTHHIACCMGRCVWDCIRWQI